MINENQRLINKKLFKLANKIQREKKNTENNYRRNYLTEKLFNLRKNV